MLVGILYIIYSAFIIGTIVLTPCYVVKKIRQKVFNYPLVGFLYTMSIVFNSMILLIGIFYYQQALSNLNLWEATILEKAWGIFSYAYGWILPYNGIVFLIILIPITFIIQLLLRKRVKKHA